MFMFGLFFFHFCLMPMNHLPHKLVSERGGVVRSTYRKSRARYGTQISSNSNDERSSCLLCFLFSVLLSVWSVSFHVEGHQRRCGGGWYQGRLTSRRKFQLLFFFLLSSLASCLHTLSRGERRTTNHQEDERRRFSFFSLRPGEPLSHLP